MATELDVKLRLLKEEIFKVFLKAMEDFNRQETKRLKIYNFTHKKD